jgi:SSS family solute:Na+ symporter
MNMPFFYLILAVFLLASFIIGKRESKNCDDYFLGGRDVKLFNLTLTFLATQLGGGVILGTLEASYYHGAYSLLYGVGLSLGLIILSLGVGARFRRMNITTIAEIFEKIYKAKGLRTLSSIVSIVSLFLILVAICLSTQKLFLSLGLQSRSLFFLFWAGTTYYTVMGGYKAVVKTDVLQVGFILFAFVFLTGALFFTKESAPLPPLFFEDLSTRDFPWISWLVSPLFFVIIGQDMGQRCFSGYSEKTVSKACFYAGILLFLCTLFPGFLGASLRNQGIVLGDGNFLLTETMKLFGNPFLSSIFIASVLMAILSTADSLLCAISSHICEDFTFLKVTDNKTKTLFFSRGATFFISLLALFLSNLFNDIISVMVLAYELSVNLLFVPIFFSIFVKEPSKESALFSMLTGFISFLCIKLFFPNILGKELIPILLSTLVFFSIHLLRRKNSMKTLKKSIYE